MLLNLFLLLFKPTLLLLFFAELLKLGVPCLNGDDLLLFYLLILDEKVYEFSTEFFRG